jgi:hypothetical protein
MKDRGPLLWVALIVAGIIVVIGVAALVGGDDDSGETVSAGEWAQGVCGAVGVWRGELESIVEDIRTPTAVGTGGEEPQSETPQGRTGFVREGLERAVGATETMVTGVERAGIPDTAQGEAVAQQVADWADSALDDLEDAEESLDEEADSLEDAIEQLTEAAGAIASTMASGARTLVEVRRTDPEVAAALDAASTCQQLEEETQG